MNELVLSLFPGIGMLDTAFEEEGFCVVRGPDVLWGGDIRRFNPPAGRFNGVIGGPPCQIFSSANRLVRFRGQVASTGNLIPEFERCVSGAKPKWFLMENVRQAPVPAVQGYGVHSFLLNNRQLGEKQNRVRRWSFGHIASRVILNVETKVFEHEERECAATTCRWRNGSQGGWQSRAVFDTYKVSQGLPPDFEIPPFRIEHAVKAVVNGVPMAMGRALAKAVRLAIEGRD